MCTLLYTTYLRMYEAVHHDGRWSCTGMLELGSESMKVIYRGGVRTAKLEIFCCSVLELLYLLAQSPFKSQWRTWKGVVMWLGAVTITVFDFRRRALSPGSFGLQCLNDRLWFICSAIQSPREFRNCQTMNVCTAPMAGGVLKEKKDRFNSHTAYKTLYKLNLSRNIESPYRRSNSKP